MNNRVILFCQKCKKRIPKEEDIRKQNMGKGIVLQVCINCYVPNFKDKAIYK